MGKRPPQVDPVTIKLSETEEAVERVALGLVETKDQTFRVESDIVGLRAAMAGGSEKFKKPGEKLMV
jgi:hypothetical protein